MEQRGRGGSQKKNTRDMEDPSSSFNFQGRVCRKRGMEARKSSKKCFRPKTKTRKGKIKEQQKLPRPEGRECAD